MFKSSNSISIEAHRKFSSRQWSRYPLYLRFAAVPLLSGLLAQRLFLYQHL